MGDKPDSVLRFLERKQSAIISLAVVLPQQSLQHTVSHRNKIRYGLARR